MKTIDSPHYEVSSFQLAEWLERSEESCWRVDGDPLLTGLISFPCFSHELAEFLKKKDRLLLLLDKDSSPEAKGQKIRIEALDTLAFVERTGDRAFQFCWKEREPQIRYGPDVDWNLIEDKEAWSEAVEENDEMNRKARDHKFGELQDSEKLRGHC